MAGEASRDHLIGKVGVLLTALTKDLIKDMERRGWGDGEVEHCYDFPAIVVHRMGCPREHGLPCFPLEQPEPPFTAEEKHVMLAYARIMVGVGIHIPVSAKGKGKTILPDGEVL